MRRTHLQHHENILKRLLIHIGAFNLSLLLRNATGSGTPRMLWDARQTRTDALDTLARRVFRAIGARLPARKPQTDIRRPKWLRACALRLFETLPHSLTGNQGYTTGC